MLKRDFLVEKMKNIGFNLTEQQTDQFETFYEDLIEKNRVMNLTTITEWEDVVIKHFVDSLAIIQICGVLKNPVRVIDVGTGAGFPGIPLAIAFPEIDLVMVDSVGKKITFINEEITKIGLAHVSAIHGRVEDLARKAAYRQQFDYCVSRAVANLSTLSEYCLPFVKKGGSFIAYKSGNCDEELTTATYAIRQLCGTVNRIEKYQIENDSEITVSDDRIVDARKHAEHESSVTSYSRTLIEITKTGNTPMKYPRKAGTPSKEPLSV